MMLYDAAWAPSPRRVRIFLAEKGLTVERVVVDLKKDEQLGPAFLKINPRGTVPVLVLDDGEVIGESSAICRYFEALHPEPPLFGTDARAIARIEDWTRRIEGDGYAAVVNTLRNAAPGFAGRALNGAWPPVEQIPALAERGRMMWERFVDVLDARLAEQEWVAGADFSFADIAALCTVDFAKAARLPAAWDRPAIARWHAAASARPSARA